MFITENIPKEQSSKNDPKHVYKRIKFGQKRGSGPPGPTLKSAFRPGLPKKLRGAGSDPPLNNAYFFSCYSEKNKLKTDIDGICK